MKLINTPTAVNHRFVDGNKEVGQKATQFNAEWCNQIQFELWNLIKAMVGGDPTGESESEAGDAFTGIFRSGPVKFEPNGITVGANGKIRDASQIGPQISGFQNIVSAILEATVKIIVGSSTWEHSAQNGDSITGLVSLISSAIQVDHIAEKTENGGIQVWHKIVGNQSAEDKNVHVGAAVVDSIDIDNGSFKANSTDGVAVDGRNFSVKSGNSVYIQCNPSTGETDVTNFNVQDKLNLGSNLVYKIDASHSVSDAESWISGRPQNTILCVVNDNTAGVVLWSGATYQTSIIGKCALLCIKVGNDVYPIIANPNY